MTAPTAQPRLLMWPVDRIRPRATNPRDELRDIDELADSIRANGLLQPLVIEQAPPGVAVVVLVDGHRRLAAVQRLEWARVPVIPRWVSSGPNALVLALATGVQRQDLSPVEEARGYQSLRATGMTARSIARATGITEARISERLRLLDLDETTLGRVSAGSLPAGRRRPRPREGTGRTSALQPHPPARRRRTHGL